MKQAKTLNAKTHGIISSSGQNYGMDFGTTSQLQTNPYNFKPLTFNDRLKMIEAQKTKTFGIDNDTLGTAMDFGNFAMNALNYGTRKALLESQLANSRKTGQALDVNIDNARDARYADQQFRKSYGFGNRTAIQV